MVTRPILNDPDIAGKPIQKYLVFGIVELVEKALNRRTCPFDLVASHAAARVEHNAHAHRHAIGAEVSDLDGLLVVIDGKVGWA